MQMKKTSESHEGEMRYFLYSYEVRCSASRFGVETGKASLACSQRRMVAECGASYVHAGLDEYMRSNVTRR